MSRDEKCPFCGLHPFEYIDIGIGSQAIAVNCCEWGELLYGEGMPYDEVKTLYDKSEEKPVSGEEQSL